MTLLAPWYLLILIIVPIIVGIYIWVWRRRRKFAVQHSNLSLIRAALPKRNRWRQHLPFALLLLAMLVLIGAIARPAAVVNVPLSRTSIILAIDVSRSMCATDVAPNRLAVAQEAALEFVEEQADGTRIGIVAFAGLAEIVVPPTNDKNVLRNALETMTTSFGTAIGSATLKSIDAIAEINENVAPSGLDLQLEEIERVVEEGNYEADIIVLLTDGANSQGPLPLNAAQQAADRRVRVYTIGFGTDTLPEMICSRAQLGSDAFSEGFGFGGFGNFGSGGFGGGGGGGDFRRFIVIDEDTLQGVADLTGGEYYRAESADQLFEVFKNLPTKIVLQKENIEISFVFLALGAIFVLIAVGLSMKWNRLP